MIGDLRGTAEAGASADFEDTEVVGGFVVHVIAHTVKLRMDRFAYQIRCRNWRSSGVLIKLDIFPECWGYPGFVGNDNDKALFIVREINGLPEAIPIGNPFPFHIGQCPIRPDFGNNPIDIGFFDQGNPAIIIGGISASRREINDQPGHQVLEDRIGGMGFRELLEVMGCV